ncbi:hypothetical protein VZT92_023761 [Zoarces viviparus]|uniref:Secreted protein n=1 Tax=Zoarces viviparus TaxID=48416 RepID=A0AAW1E827_ZOAVI
MTAVFGAECVIILVFVAPQAPNVRSQRRPRRFLNYTRYELNQRLRTHRIRHALPGQNQSKKPLKSVPLSGRRPGSDSISGSLESD